MTSSDEIIYLQSLKYILQYNCELVMSYNNKTATIFYTRMQTKEIPFEIGETISIDEKVELDSGDYELNEQSFRRTENWGKHLAELKEKHPILFRKEKINKLLKNLLI